MIVADTNTIAYLIVKGDHTPLAREVYRKDPEWTAPPLWRSEFRNVLVCYMRQKRMMLQQAIQLAEAAELLMLGKERDVRSDAVLRLASTRRCSAYDCEFVVLAQNLGVPLITMDSRLREEFPQIALSPEQFVA